MQGVINGNRHLPAVLVGCASCHALRKVYAKRACKNYLYTTYSLRIYALLELQKFMAQKTISIDLQLWAKAVKHARAVHYTDFSGLLTKLILNDIALVNRRAVTIGNLPPHLIARAAVAANDEGKDLSLFIEGLLEDWLKSPATKTDSAILRKTSVKKRRHPVKN